MKTCVYHQIINAETENTDQQIIIVKSANKWKIEYKNNGLNIIFIYFKLLYIYIIFSSLSEIYKYFLCIYIIVVGKLILQNREIT